MVTSIPSTWSYIVCSFFLSYVVVWSSSLARIVLSLSRFLDLDLDLQFVYQCFTFLQFGSNLNVWLSYVVPFEAKLLANSFFYATFKFVSNSRIWFHRAFTCYRYMQNTTNIPLSNLKSRVVNYLDTYLVSSSPSFHSHTQLFILISTNMRYMSLLFKISLDIIMPWPIISFHDLINCIYMQACP